MTSELKNSKEKKKRKFHFEYTFVTLLFFGLFVWMVVYFVRFVYFDSEEFAKSSYNSRLSAFSEKIIRGDIYTSDKVQIATTVTENGVDSRYYEYPNMFCHLVGYVTKGLTGVERDASDYLLANNNDYKTKIFNDIYDIRSDGDDVYTTVSYKLQRAAYENFSGYDGAIIAIEPSTGKVLCMVSRPDFNMNSIQDVWGSITDDATNSTLLNRAVAGLYPPGSTFKLVTELAYMRQHSDFADYKYNCTGSVELNERMLHCVGGTVHGPVDFVTSLAYSCNCSLANMGLNMNVDKYRKTAEDLYFNKNIPTSISGVKKSSFALSKSDDEMMVGSTAMGQGETLVTPLHMCFITAAICNEGLAMEPYYIDKILAPDGYVTKQYNPKKAGQLMTKAEAAELKKNMRAMIETNSGSALNVPEYMAYGKTGTAEISSEPGAAAHSWFVCFAEGHDGRQIAVACIMEKAGSGYSHALPLCKQVIDAYFNVEAEY